MNELESKLRQKAGEDSGVSACLCFFPFLREALSSNPSQRPLLA